MTILVTSHAQTRWNFLTGIGFSTFDTDLLENYGFEDSRESYIARGGSASSPSVNSIRPGFFLSISSDIKISEQEFIKVGIAYTTTGDAYYFKTDDIQYQGSYGTTSDAKIKMRPRLDYVAIKVNYGDRISDRISLYGGFTPGINVLNVIRTNKFTGDSDDLKEKWDRTDNDIVARPVVLFGNVGISYYLLDGLTVIDLNINKSLMSVYNDPFFNGTTALFNEAGMWNIEAGIGLYLGRLGTFNDRTRDLSRSLQIKSPLTTDTQSNTYFSQFHQNQNNDPDFFLPS